MSNFCIHELTEKCSVTVKCLQKYLLKKNLPLQSFKIQKSKVLLAKKGAKNGQKWPFMSHNLQDFFFQHWKKTETKKKFVFYVVVFVSKGHSKTTWTQFCLFLTTTYLYRDIFNPERGQE